nr:hypothetical protein [sulfur-oxidizing endosymbiont of Gigantopelta aegis]
MKKAGLFCKTKRRFKATTNSKHNKRISPNLLEREFTVSQPDRYYVGDITYISIVDMRFKRTPWNTGRICPMLKIFLRH